MKFSNPCLAALPLAALIQLVSRTKAASTTGLQIVDGMVVELCKGSNITAGDVGNWTPALIVGDYSSNGGASLTITGGSYVSINANGMEVNGGSVATVLGGLIQGGLYGDGMFVHGGSNATVLGGIIQGGKFGDGMSVWPGAVATVCDGMIQAGTGWYHGWVTVYVATVRIAGGIIIGGNSTASGSPFGYGFYNWFGNATITGGTFKGGFDSTSGDQAPSLVFTCGNTSIYGGTYEGNWTFIDNYGFCGIYTKVYGKDLFLKDNHLVGTLCDGNPIDVKILILGEPITVNIENNCASFPEFEECGGKGGKSGKKTKNSLFRP